MYVGDLKSIIENAETVVRCACRLNGDESRKGGFLCVTDNEGAVQAVVLVGVVSDPEKRDKYLKNCLEKAARLSEKKFDMSSFESRDPDLNRWAGAVRGRELIYSFSGLPELWDEACMLVLGYHFYPRQISPDRLNAVAQISNNPYVQRLAAVTNPARSCSDPAN